MIDGCNLWAGWQRAQAQKRGHEIVRQRPRCFLNGTHNDNNNHFAGARAPDSILLLLFILVVCALLLHGFKCFFFLIFQSSPSAILTYAIIVRAL